MWGELARAVAPRRLPQRMTYLEVRDTAVLLVLRDPAYNPFIISRGAGASGRDLWKRVAERVAALVGDAWDSAAQRGVTLTDGRGNDAKADALRQYIYPGLKTEFGLPCINTNNFETEVAKRKRTAAAAVPVYSGHNDPSGVKRVQFKLASDALREELQSAEAWLARNRAPKRPAAPPLGQQRSDLKKPRSAAPLAAPTPLLPPPVPRRDANEASEDSSVNGADAGTESDGGGGGGGHAPRGPSKRAAIGGAHLRSAAAAAAAADAAAAASTDRTRTTPQVAPRRAARKAHTRREPSHDETAAAAGSPAQRTGRPTAAAQAAAAAAAAAAVAAAAAAAPAEPAADALAAEVDVLRRPVAALITAIVRSLAGRPRMSAGRERSRLVMAKLLRDMTATWSDSARGGGGGGGGGGDDAAQSRERLIAVTNLMAALAKPAAQPPRAHADAAVEALQQQAESHALACLASLFASHRVRDDAAG